MRGGGPTERQCRNRDTSSGGIGAPRHSNQTREQRWQGQLRLNDNAAVSSARTSHHGACSDRRELNRLLGKLAPGDVVTVTRIDRLARSNFDPFAIVKRIVDAKAEFRSLAEPWADTGTSSGCLMLAVLGGLADV